MVETINRNNPVSGPEKPREGPSLVLLTAILGVGLLVFYFFNPAESRGFWVCPFHRLTGWYCPGCGGQRAFHELLHLRLGAALRLNPLAVLVFLPAAAYAYTAYALRVMGIARLPVPVLRGWAVVLFLAATMLFGVLRNVWGPLP